jgi:error-prone DNA polymerase
MQYVELHCKTNFSFLEGASHADELVEKASELGYSGIAVTDRNSLAGIVRSHTAAKDANIPLLVGSQIYPMDGPPVLLWAMDRPGYGQLCRLITEGRMRGEKGQCPLSWHDIAAMSSGLLAGLVLRRPVDDWMAGLESHAMHERFAADRLRSNDVYVGQDAFDPRAVANESGAQHRNGERLASETLDFPTVDFDPREDAYWLDWLGVFKEIFGDRAYLMAAIHRGLDDENKIDRLRWLSRQSTVPLVVGGDVQYHAPERMILHDCLAATALGETVDKVRLTRPPNAQFAMRSLTEIGKLFHQVPDAIARTVEIQSRCDFNLEQLRYEYPVELAPDGQSSIEFLKRVTWRGAKERYDNRVPEKVIDLLRHEIELIEELGYEAYFLTVWDLVRFARSKGILCQGRGSAANSTVCFCLGITSIDPSKMDLLFERFISRERNEAPDIDVDFEHQRREEVLQYIYEKYGRHRAGMTATVTTYRARSAIRDAGKSLGVSLDRIDALVKIVEGRSSDESLGDRCRLANIDPDSELGKRFLYVVESLIGFPRHLSQHVGGMVMTQGPLCELCPMENASMPGRTVIQWDKDDLDELGILKVDCLSLGMLSAIRRCFEMIAQRYGRKLTLASLPPDDKEVYDMICRADTVGVFQIESRAQMSMLPRLRPRCYYDLVIEVAIVRPGPIQGNMVHPYLKARRGGPQPEYPNDAIRKVLDKTLGVPIFQEQAMKLAVVAAGFTPGEADQLRRAMAAWRRPGVIDKFRRKLLDGMLANGLNEQFAEVVFTQIRGFGEYGFPESHAASFALLVYASCWLKHHYPAAFCASIINSLPMGFYGPSQLVQDAQRHGVTVRGCDINRSDWECTLEDHEPPRDRRPGGRPAERIQAIRLGFCMVKGLPSEIIARILAERNAHGPFAELSDLVRRTRISQALVTRLAEAGTLGSVAGDRRAALWQSLSQPKNGEALTLFESQSVDVDEPLPEELQSMSRLEEVYADYSTSGISLRGHPIAFCRFELSELKVTPARELPNKRNGQFIRVAGIVLLRQRPGTAKGITFVTIEDETGSINLVIRPNVWKDHYTICKQASAWLVHGVFETRDDVINIVVARIEDLSKMVKGLSVRSRDFR